VAAMLAAHAGWAPGERTLQRHFARLGLNTRPDGTPPAAFGRFEAAARNELWTGDALHGPKIDGRKTYLFAFIDDHSRALVGYRWGHSEDTVRLEAALRAALAARGVPRRIYVDNGSAFVDSQLLRACASLGIGLVHSRPGQPAGRGKIERVFRTVREQFLVEIADGTETAEGPDRAGSPIVDLAELNSTFTAWVEQVYHRRPHTETGQPPLARWLAPGPPTLPTREALHEAFLWSERRTVTKTATVSLHGNTYEVDAALVGHRVELVFDPFDLTDIAVRYQGRALGPAIPHRIGRHVHRKARPDTDTAAPAPTGIDYLHLIETAHTAELTQRLRYDQLDDQHDGDQHDGDQDLVGQDRADAVLEAELAGFAELTDQLRADGQLPGQLALTDHPEPAEPGELGGDSAERAS
ncbi:MAG: DDE-type integrase/transposase/recombinase, partial [Actinomycetota bacterium]|nr:DDE-type integrase/transposase/recombinase [Actinomycetota bacterium]